MEINYEDLNTLITRNDQRQRGTCCRCCHWISRSPIVAELPRSGTLFVECALPVSLTATGKAGRTTGPCTSTKEKVSNGGSDAHVNP
jgi:hypothetical protein